MRNIEILIGSPRRRGNTSLMADMLVDGLNMDKCASNISFLYDYDIRPCEDCRGCKKGEKVCILNDDMKRIYPKVESSDVLIIATPIYWYGPSAKTKLLLDRFRPYYANERLAGKHIAHFLPAGTGAPDCDLTMEMFRRFAEALQLEFLGSVTAKAYDIGEVRQDKNAMESVLKLAEQINGSI